MNKRKGSKFPASTSPRRQPAGINPDFAAIADYEKKLQSLRQVTIQSRHIGPLPPPEILREYEKIIPNAGERLLSVVEREQEHRHSYEKYIVESAVKDAGDGRRAHLRGDIIAVAVFLICSAMGMTLLFLDMNQYIAGALLGAPLIGSLASFLVARRGFNSTEHQQKKISEQAGEEKAPEN
jgi:uncharacterized membrane protein